MEDLFKIAEGMESELESDTQLKESREQAIIRESFNEAILKELKPKQNSIETRCITNDQIQKLVATLEDKKDPKHYYLRKKY